MKKVCSLFILLFFLISEGFAGPFGLDKGMSLDEARRHGSIESTPKMFQYRSKMMNNGYPDADFYTFIITPKSGLCKISVATVDIPTSAYGTELVQKYDDIKSALTQKYGSPSRDFDFLRAGSIWNEPKDWMMGLLKNERTRAAFWTGRELQDSIKAIKVEAEALSSSKGYISFSYEFTNIDQCMDELKSQRNKNI